MILHRLCHFLVAQFLVCCACRGSSNNKPSVWQQKLAVSTGVDQTFAKQVPSLSHSMEQRKHQGVALPEYYY